MKNQKSISYKQLKELIQENRDFILALNRGACADELNKIRRRVTDQGQKEASRFNLYPGKT
ncbi:MAG TPA: hypothetical protein VFP87_11875 [Chitinophagaceae bacterium]|nr:hypothetical protein [Chitinophagaceae bacterium]